MTDKPDIDKLIRERPDLFDATDCRPGFDRDTGIRVDPPEWMKKAIEERERRREGEYRQDPE